ncbi:GerMN domain-containing protein, partial [Brachyspira catarrhinii]
MPRYEPYKSRYKGNYTRQIKNESKEINLKKPLIISVVFIISAAVIFSIIKNYAPIVDIAIKDFFSINHREAIALGNDEIVEDNSDKLSFLSNIPLFNFFIKSDTNQTLSVMAYETNSMLETVLSDNENLTNSTSINRESLLPFFNENYNTNYYNSSIYRESQNQNISENIESIENNNINNNENEPYNYIQQMINESGRNNANNFVNSNNSSANNNSARNNNSINNINNNSSNFQTASIFQDILKPKENAERVIKTMKPASTGFSSEIPSYMQNNNYNNNANTNINNNPTNNYNNFFSDIEDRNELLNNNNNRERIINNSRQRDNRIENGNNNTNNNYGRKNIIEETIFKNNSQKTSDYERVINDMVNPNNNIARDNNNINNNLNNANNINNIKRETPANTKNDKEEIMKKAKTDVANYKRRKANNTINGINRDFNNIKTKSKDEGIYLVEYDENSGAITLIFRNRNFNNNISIESAIKTLLNGATDDENNKNIISCIPRNTELLDIFVEDDIVYLNFNEDFEFNPLGNQGTM